MFKDTLVTSLALFAGLAAATPLVPRQGGNGPYTGDVTFFQPGLEACGTSNPTPDFVVAVSTQFFTSFGPLSTDNPICGRQIKTTAPNGKTVTVAVVDECPGCAEFDLSMSPAAFEMLADLSTGLIHGVTWELL